MMTSPRLFRPSVLLAALFSFCVATAHAQLNVIANVSPTTLPAASAGGTFSLIGDFTNGGAQPYTAFFCFYTGFGSTAPLAGATGANSYGFASFVVPNSTIQAIPPASFTGGTFNALVYAVANGAVACNGQVNQNFSNSITVPIQFPTLNTPLVSIPQPNVNLQGVPAPRIIDLAGSNFNANSVVTLAGNLTPAVALISSTALRVTLPANLPSTATPIPVQVCNVATFTYCATTQNNPVTALGAQSGALVATPNPGLPSSSISQVATFTPAFRSVGVPIGAATFADGATTLGTAPLVFGTGNFVTGTAGFFKSSAGATLQPIQADFNQDGLQDVLIFDNSTQNLHVMLAGDNQGGFLSESVVALSNAAFGCPILYSAAVGDFNGDGYPDIALLCSNNGPANLYVLLNQGDGTFNGSNPATVVTTAVTANGPAMTVGDFNKDGNLDIVIAGAINYPNTVSGFQVYLGTGKGGFVPGPQTPIQNLKGSQLYASDLNNDGYPDLVFIAVSGSQTPVEAFQNGGAGSPATFGGGPIYQRTFGDGQSASQVLFRKLPGSAYPDLVIISTGQLPEFDVVLNGKTLTTSFGLPSTVTVPGIRSAAVGDFNGDTFPDVATYDGTSIKVFPSNAIGTYSTPLNSFTFPANNLQLALTADPNADGFADLIAVTPLINAASAQIQTYMTTATATATLPGRAFTPGSHSLTATIPGTVTLAGTTAQTTLVVNKFAPSVQLSVAPVSPTAYVPNVTQTLSASVTANSLPAPTGAIQFFDGQTLLGTVPTTITQFSANASLVTGPLTAGTHTLTAIYVGDVNYAPASSQPTTYIVQKSTPAIAWTPNPNTIVYGTALSAAQLNATASVNGINVPGTFVYSPASGAILTAGTQTLNVTFTPTDTTDFNTATGTTSIIVTQATPTITWLPNPASIVYGTALSAAQLNATATLNGTPVAGTFAYNPAAGAILTAGTQALSLVFSPTDTVDFKVATGTATITVTKATPTLNWPTPAPIIAGTALSATQLNATATGAGGTALPGSFVYSPAAGTVLPSGIQTLNVTFTPTDLTDYIVTTTTTQLNVVALTLTSLTPSTSLLGDPAKTITITGTGFAANAIASVDGAAVPTTFVNTTTLTAVVPASVFTTVHSAQVLVNNPTQGFTSNTLTLPVTAPPVTVVLTGPSTVTTGTQPTLTFSLTNPYPVTLTGTLTLTFAPASGLPNDPTIVFANGTRTIAFTIPANSTATPAVQFQSGSVAGTITITLALTAGGVNVTPGTLQPVVIAAPAAVPGITAVTLTRSGNTLTVLITGYSNTREMVQTNFHFDASPGNKINTPDLTILGPPLFGAPWYGNLAASQQYGSTFGYTQTFNIDQDASVVGSVTVTLVNTIGTSKSGSAQ